jgi:hypothetical protein
MLGELLKALGDPATSISAWPDREDGRWRWVHWGFAAILAAV